ncbi:penicillin-binding protein 1A [Moraxella oblonga]|uniref:penicillin-binding protein 1A n=1 Tax=Moraxella oblonga TaxID=200413 RepID=UPI000A012EBD|nr:PBP1A family penicillin-binding protein [Moraxella oblonga]
MSQKNYTVRLISFVVSLILAFFALVLVLILAFPIGFYGMALYLEPSLPNIKELKTMQLQMPLQIYTADGKLIGQYGNTFSLPATYEELPKPLIQAFLAAEDDTFFEHTGISVKGLGRAIKEVVTDDDSQTGGSTITMQVVKNYFLSPERTIERKLTEMFIARKIENKMTKDEIMTLYVNKIYLGEGAYGVKAAARRYYSKSLENLTIAEMAMLAGLPKAPSQYNPVKNEARALERRNWIVGRMFEKGFITKQQRDEAINAPTGLHMYQETLDENMPYIAELARQTLVDKFGEKVMDSGWRVQLTIDTKKQRMAENAVSAGLTRYEPSVMARGYRGVEALEGNLVYFKKFSNGMQPAQITKVTNSGFTAVLQNGETITLPKVTKWNERHVGTNRYEGNGNSKNTPKEIKVGNIVRVIKDGGVWRITQPRRIQGALASLNPENGALIAVVGGMDFNQSKFNRATQGYRQPGSTIKPLIYAAALEYTELTPNSYISNKCNFGRWCPKGGGKSGSVPMYVALSRSLNIHSANIMRTTEIKKPGITHQVLSQMGLEKERLENTGYTLALGATDATPLQMATAYTTFVNGGHRIQPYVIERIYNFNSETIYQASPVRACAICFNKELVKTNTALLDAFTKQQAELAEKNKNNPVVDERDGQAKYDRLKPKQAIQYKSAEQAPRILSHKTAYNMATMLRGVIAGGTGKDANFRSDIGGKTGTTNLAKDVWFIGVHPTNSAAVWMGYDRPSSLGPHAFGGKLALPIWRSYMSAELAGKPIKWVDKEDVSKIEKTTSKIVNITDDNVNDINKVLKELGLSGVDATVDENNMDGMEEENTDDENDETDTN